MAYALLRISDAAPRRTQLRPPPSRLGLMTQNKEMASASTWNVLGILGFAVMIVVQVTGGIDDYPTIPPGIPIALAISALVVFAARWRWTTIPAAVFPGIVLVGAVVTDSSRERLSGTGSTFDVASTWVQVASLLLALGAGIVAVAQRYGAARQGSRPEA